MRTRGAPEPAPTGQLAVARLIRSTNRGFGQCLQTSLARFGFSSGMWHFLRVLIEKDGITQRELSQRAGVVEPNALKQIEPMERQGLVRRVRDETDRRKMRLYLTDAGRALYVDLVVPATDIPKAALDGIPAGDVERLIRHLRHIQANLDAYHERLMQGAPAAPTPRRAPANN